MENQIQKAVTVACAVIEHRYQYLILRRAAHKENPGLWEFPGGKVHDGESLKGCVEREIAEELEVKAEALSFMASVECMVGDKLIRLYALKTVIDQEPVKLKDHSEMNWVTYEDLGKYPMTEPDLALLHQLQGHGLKEMEISHIGAWSMARLYGVIYGIIGTVMGIYIVFSSQSEDYGMEGLTAFYKVALVLAMPFVNFGVGAVFGIVFSFFYNLIAEMIGGIKVRLK